MKTKISPEPALLGFLLDAPMHGYELFKQVQEGLGPVWHLGLSQMYAIVGDYAARGWIRTRVEAQGVRPSKKILEITPAGRKTFETWMAQPAHGLREFRVDFFARLYFARAAGRKDITRLIDQQIAASRAELERLQAEQASTESRQNKDDFHQALLQFRVQQLSTALKWLEKNRGRLLPARNTARATRTVSPKTISSSKNT
jgi:DNA-binding PadR family transcriptional regulator